MAASLPPVESVESGRSAPSAHDIQKAQSTSLGAWSCQFLDSIAESINTLRRALIHTHQMLLSALAPPPLQPVDIVFYSSNTEIAFAVRHSGSA